MANEFIVKNGFKSQGDSEVTGSFTATSGMSGSFSGSFQGDGSSLSNVTLPAGVVSGSAQISYTGITDVPSGIVSSSAQIASDISGSFGAASASFSTRITTNENDISTLTAATASYILASQTSSMTVLSSSFAVSASYAPSADAFPFIGDAVITGSLNVSGSITTFDINMSTWTLGADGGSNYYYFTGPGDLGGTEQNPDIHLIRGQKYRFYNPLNAHPFQIQDTGGSAFNTGVTNNGVQLGFLSFDVPMDAPTHLLYQCTAHAAMKGNIYIANARISSGSFSGSFQGDGSQLTGISSGGGTPTFIASGSTSASAAPDTGVVVEHSGSTAFSVIGDVGTLFSIDDDLNGMLFTANDISGFPVLQASASGEVYIGKTPQSLYTTAVISSTTAATTHSLCTLSTSSYDGAFFEYTAQSASNARAGNITSTWNGTDIVYAETTTADIGRTSDLTTEVIISGSTARLVAYGANAGYKIKTIIKAI